MGTQQLLTQEFAGFVVEEFGDSVLDGDVTNCMTDTSSIDSNGESEHPDFNESSTTIPETRGDQRSAFEDAAEAIAGGESARPSDTAPFGSEIGNLEEWAHRQGALISDTAFDCLDTVSNSTSEHEVFYRPVDSRAVKRTWAGVYGQIPHAANGKLDRRNASPSEYLRRMALHISVFGSDLKLEGVTISSKPSMIIGQPAGQPSIVISQRWYEREGLASNEAIHQMLVDEGFRPVPSSYFGWYRPTDGSVIVDAKPDNFIQTREGLIPIDLQMAQFTPEQLKTAGLTSDPSAPVIFIPR